MDIYRAAKRKFSNRVLPPIFISTILESEKFLNLAHYFLYDVKLRLLAHSRSFLANQKARNAIVGAENLLINSYSPKWRWLAVDIYRAVKQRGKYPTLTTDTEVNSWDNTCIHHKKLIWMISSLVMDANWDTIFY